LGAATAARGITGHIARGDVYFLPDSGKHGPCMCDRSNHASLTILGNLQGGLGPSAGQNTEPIGVSWAI